jgi:hypothetical protein
MYSEAELEAAVAEGAISPEAAGALREFVARRRQTPSADEEQFRLLTGFNDIFVTIAALLLLAALAWMGQALGGVLMAAASWGLAEFFTRRRRMALPSIVLLLSWTGGAIWTGGMLGHAVLGGKSGLGFAVGAAAGVAAAWVHWRRFKVPITVAAGAVAAVGAVVTFLTAAVPGLAEGWYLLVLAGGLGLFGLAMRWDMSDRARVTRRSDVAFWLHLAAAPMIVHPVFALLGLLKSGAGLDRAAMALALYLGLAAVALTIDRRAMLVSALFYVMYALTELIRATGAVDLSLAVTAVVVGSGLLTLSAFWHPTRRAVLRLMPDELRARVPAA